MSSVSSPYMRWAKTHPRQRWDVTSSNLLAVPIDELPGAREAVELSGDADEGYGPLIDAIAARYGVGADRVATAGGTSGANFLACAALLGPGDDVLVERPGYDPLLAIPGLLGVGVNRFDRRFEDGFALDPAAVRHALTSRTRLVIITNAHNPSGVVAGDAALDEIGRIAERAGARVLVDEVYLDAAKGAPTRPAAARSGVFVTTSSLTKSYGLPGLRCGWVIAEPEVAARIRRMRDIVDAIGAYPAERLSLVAFGQLDQLVERARSILDRNAALVGAFLRGRPELECLVPVRGLVTFPRLRDVDDAGPFVERLARQFQVGVVPGRFFETPAHFRMALGGRSEVLAAALEGIGRALDAGQPGRRA